MNIVIREFKSSDIEKMQAIWNEVVIEGNAFPQIDELNIKTSTTFFASQTYCAVAENIDNLEILGLYILHPNNIGRCAHICNASYAVSSIARGQHLGELLVKDCLKQANLHGFRVLQFNAVVATNIRARRLYEKLGFTQLGVIPGGFKLKDGYYEDICPYYHLV
jgi:L-amino acid N-acyltransferase YncA